MWIGDYEGRLHYVEVWAKALMEIMHGRVIDSRAIQDSFGTDGAAREDVPVHLGIS